MEDKKLIQRYGDGKKWGGHIGGLRDVYDTGVSHSEIDAQSRHAAEDAAVAQAHQRAADAIAKDAKTPEAVKAAEAKIAELQKKAAEEQAKTDKERTDALQKAKKAREEAEEKTREADEKRAAARIAAADPEKPKAEAKAA